MSSLNCWAVLVLLCIGYVAGQISNSVDGLKELKKQVEESPELDDVKKQLQESGVNVPNLDIDNIDPQKVENVLREKCENQGAIYAVDTLKTQQDFIKECLNSHLNSSALQSELEEAKKTGSMDEVFAEYCGKWPRVYACFNDASAIVQTCLNPQEIQSFNRSLDIIEQLQEFMCQKGGDRLALFVAEGGVECLNQTQEDIKSCINSTFGSRIPNSADVSVSNLPIFLFDAKDCDDFDSLRICMKDHMEMCSDTTPANIVDATFKFIRKQMMCEDIVLKADTLTTQESSASRLLFTSLVPLAIGVALVFRF